MGGFSASARQRVAVAEWPCAYCGREGKCDPAHVWPRGMGGCDEPECVVPLCRGCHTKFDTGRLNLLSVLQSSRYAKQYEHAIAHAGSQARADWKISNQRPV